MNFLGLATCSFWIWLRPEEKRKTPSTRNCLGGSGIGGRKARAGGGVASRSTLGGEGGGGGGGTEGQNGGRGVTLKESTHVSL